MCSKSAGPPIAAATGGAGTEHDSWVPPKSLPLKRQQHPPLVISSPLTLQQALILGNLTRHPGVIEGEEKCLVSLTTIQRSVYPQTSWCHPAATN